MDRKYDLIVFGATGVTGKIVVEELARNEEGIKWAISGRNETKLKQVLKEVGNLAGKNLDSIEVFVADVEAASLPLMCQNTKIVLNCVGPYRFSGEQVVKACIESGTHYVDVSGEPQFLETIQLKYFEEAKMKKVFIVGACGFDSVPCDMGVEFLKQEFQGDINGVETYLKLCSPGVSKANFGTWQSAIYSFAHSSELKHLRIALKEKLFTKGLFKPSYPLKSRSLLFKSDQVDSWCLPFLGSDKSVVLRTQMYELQFKNERPVQIQTYFCTKSLLSSFLMLIMAGIFAMFAKFKVGRYFLEMYPEIFSLGLFTTDSPKREELIGGSFSMTLCADGWSERLADPSDIHALKPDKKMKVVVSGPDGYTTTAICAVACCATILKEQEHMPKDGGVFTPGAAFGHTNLIEKLGQRNLIMAVME